MNKSNSDPFDHYSEKVFLLFFLSVLIALASFIGAFFVARGYMESVREIRIECAKTPISPIYVDPGSSEPIIGLG